MAPLGDRQPPAEVRGARRLGEGWVKNREPPRPERKGLLGTQARTGRPGRRPRITRASVGGDGGRGLSKPDGARVGAVWGRVQPGVPPPPAPTHALRWHRDWMQMSRRRRSRGRGGPRLGCSASAAGGRWGSRPAGGRAGAGADPPTAPGLTCVQRGRERVEAGDGRRVLAAGQVQAGAAAEGALGVGLRGARRSFGVRPPPARAPRPPARTHQVVAAELVQRAPLHRRVPAQAAVEGGLDTRRPRARDQGRGQQRQHAWVPRRRLLVLPDGGRALGGAARAGLRLRALALPHRVWHRASERWLHPSARPRPCSLLGTRCPQHQCASPRFPDPAAAPVSLQALATRELAAQSPGSPASPRHPTHASPSRCCFLCLQCYCGREYNRISSPAHFCKDAGCK